MFSISYLPQNDTVIYSCLGKQFSFKYEKCKSNVPLKSPLASCYKLKVALFEKLDDTATTYTINCNVCNSFLVVAFS